MTKRQATTADVTPEMMAECMRQNLRAQKVTISLCERTGINYSIQVKKGKNQLTVVDYSGKKVVVHVHSEWLGLDELLALMESM